MEILVHSTYWLFPEGADNIPQDKEELQEFYNRRYQNAFQAHKNATRILGANCAFISEELYESFMNLTQLCNWQIVHYPIFIKHDSQDKQILDCYAKTSEIIEAFKLLQKQIRDYLKTLDVFS